MPNKSFQQPALSFRNQLPEEPKIKERGTQVLEDFDDRDTDSVDDDAEIENKESQLDSDRGRKTEDRTEDYSTFSAVQNLIVAEVEK